MNIIGKRIKLIKMNDEIDPVEDGAMGTIIHVGADVINVNWDNGRMLGVIMGTDEYEILDDEQNN